MFILQRVTKAMNKTNELERENLGDMRVVWQEPDIHAIWYDMQAKVSPSEYVENKLNKEGTLVLEGYRITEKWERNVINPHLSEYGIFISNTNVELIEFCGADVHIIQKF